MYVYVWGTVCEPLFLCCPGGVAVSLQELEACVKKGTRS